MCSLKGLISLSEVGVKCSSLGMSTSFTHSVTHSPSCCMKEGASDEGSFRDTPPPGVAYAPPVSNGPFSEHFPINMISSSASPCSARGKQFDGV